MSGTGAESSAGPGRALPPCVVFEDDDLLVVDKPAGWNTHAPSPYAGEGIYEWLRHREPRWASLAILHRLDKETSGLLVFGKTPAANRSLTEQFTARTVDKTYVLVTDRPADVPGSVGVLAVGTPIDNVGFAGGDVIVEGDDARWRVVVTNPGERGQERTLRIRPPVNLIQS